MLTSPFTLFFSSFLPVVHVDGSSAFLVFRAKEALIPAPVQIQMIQDLVVRCRISVPVQVQSTYLQNLSMVSHSPQTLGSLVTSWSDFLPPRLVFPACELYP